MTYLLSGIAIYVVGGWLLRTSWTTLKYTYRAIKYIHDKMLAMNKYLWTQI